MSIELKPYQYFVGPGGATFCAESCCSNTIAASIVYNPATDGEANRRRVTDSTLHRKEVLDGTPREEENIFDMSLLRLLSEVYTTVKNTGQRIISVPTSEVKKYFDHKESLEELLKRPPKDFPTEVLTQLRKATNFMVRSGIPLDDLGLYGGLQSFMVHVDTGAPFKDVDFCVFGLEHVPLIKQLAAENQIHRIEKRDSRKKVVSQQIRGRRHQLTRIHIPEDETGLFCDIKVLRKEGDQQSFSDDLVVTGKIEIVEGRVVQAVEALSQPSTFEIINSQSGEKMMISSSHYNFVGAADEGDHVRVVAAGTDDPNHHLLLTPEEHSIEYIENDIELS